MLADFLSVREAAARLGVSHTTLYRSIREGDAPVPPLKIGRRTVFRTSDVDNFIHGIAS